MGFRPDGGEAGSVFAPAVLGSGTRNVAGSGPGLQLGPRVQPGTRSETPFSDGQPRVAVKRANQCCTPHMHMGGPTVGRDDLIFSRSFFSRLHSQFATSASFLFPFIFSPSVQSSAATPALPASPAVLQQACARAHRTCSRHPPVPGALLRRPRHPWWRLRQRALELHGVVLATPAAKVPASASRWRPQPPRSRSIS